MGFPPCTAQACVEILDFYRIPLVGKHVVVIGRSLVVGKPVSMMLLRRNASVTILPFAHREPARAVPDGRHRHLRRRSRARVRKEYFRAGQTVLDVGINFDSRGTLCGDVNFDEVELVVDAITPVPGGIGTVTTSVTMAHVVDAAEKMAGR